MTQQAGDDQREPEDRLQMTREAQSRLLFFGDLFLIPCLGVGYYTVRLDRFARPIKAQ